MTFDPRKSTLDILTNLDTTQKTLDQLIDNIFKQYPQASQRDKALLFAVTYGVLRWRYQLDWVIKAFSTTKLRKIDSRVLNILRIGLFQIMHLNRIPVSAAVNTSVEMAKQVSAPWVVKYVNGVLRNAAKGYASVSLPDSQKEPVKYLSVSQSFPEWLIQRWIARFGPDNTQTLCQILNKVPDITLRSNTLKTDRTDLMASLEDQCRHMDKTQYVPDGIRINGPKTPFSDMAEFNKGHFSIQDEAAQAVSHLLAPKPGETVLDACCGLGGKTGHLAQLMKNIGTLVAMDRNGPKLAALEAEMTRLGITIIKPVHHDLLNPTPKPDLPLFDKILLDTPCSGLGVIRRNPDTKWRMTPEKIAQLSAAQFTLLNNCAKLLKTDGRLVYAVCSMEPEENEEVIRSFRDRNKAFIIEKPNPLWPGWLKELVDKKGFLRTFPHKHQMDGFFAVRLKKRG